MSSKNNKIVYILKTFKISYTLKSTVNSITMRLTYRDHKKANKYLVFCGKQGLSFLLASVIHIQDRNPPPPPHNSI